MGAGMCDIKPEGTEPEFVSFAIHALNADERKSFEPHESTHSLGASVELELGIARFKGVIVLTGKPGTVICDRKAGDVAGRPKGGVSLGPARVSLNFNGYFTRLFCTVFDRVNTIHDGFEQ